MCEEIMDLLKNAMLCGDKNNFENLIIESISIQTDPLNILKILDNILIEVGDLFNKKIIYLPDLMIAGTFYEVALKHLNPILEKRNIIKNAKGTIVIGTVKGDLHTIGKSIVSNILRSAGFNVVDIGVDISPIQFIDAINRYNADVLGMSSLLTVTAIEQKNVIDLLNIKKIRNKIKVIVGGGAIDQSWSDKIGADGYSPNAIDAVKLVNNLLIKQNEVPWK